MNTQSGAGLRITFDDGVTTQLVESRNGNFASSRTDRLSYPFYVDPAATKLTISISSFMTPTTSKVISKYFVVSQITNGLAVV